jgi:hypothetical protein
MDASDGTSSEPDELSSPLDALLSLGDGPGGGDESGAIKPWLGAIRAPKNPPPISAAAPTAQLDLQWVHGYTSASAGAKNTRISSNLFYNADKCAVYPAAALGVLLNTAAKGDVTHDAAGGGAGAGGGSHHGGKGRNHHRGGAADSAAAAATSKSHYKQSYFVGHDDDILCLAISKDRRFIATGQVASKSSRGKGSVIVWDALQSRMLCRMDGCHQRAVTSLAFNPEGTQLVSVGQDDSNTHTLWADLGGGWSRVQQVASAKGDKAPVRRGCMLYIVY